MARRKREKITYNYSCTITDEEFVLSTKAPNPGELVSVEGYYQLNPEEDDRPADIRKQIGADRVASSADDSDGQD